MAAGVKVLAFAGARDVVGRAEFDWPLDAPCSAGALFDALCERFPALQPHRPSLRLAVNGVYATSGAQVAPGDEVALIPPVAGG